jgi:hypothetical protein
MKTFNGVAVSFSERVTIFVSATRSYASLAKAVGIVNTNLYGSDAFEEDRIEFNPVHTPTGDLSHFELTGTPLDFFQIGVRYGEIEEKKNVGRIDWSA